MAKKSIGTILGEIFLAFKKGELETDVIDAELLGMSPEAFVGRQLGTLSATKFEQFINSFTPATAEQRRAKVEALTAIKEGKKPFKKFREDFAAAASDTDDETVKETTTKIAAGSGPNLSSPVTVEQSSTVAQDVAETTRERRIGQTPVPAAVSGKQTSMTELETYGIDENTYVELSTKFGFSPTEEDILNWVATQPEEDRFEAQVQAQAYFNLMTGETILRPAYNDDGTAVLINGKQPLMPFPGHFVGTKVNDILDNYATEDEILQFQNFLTNNNLVPDNYFAESQGEMSEKLRASIMYVMNWADKNIHAVPGTELYKAISEEDPIYFSESQSLYGEWDIHRNIFNHALKELAKKQETLDEVEEAEIAKKLAKEYIPPSKSALEDMVDAYFENKLGRKATEEELDVWSTNFADSYSIAFAQARSKAQQLQDANFMQSQPEYLEMKDREALAQQYGAEKVIDLSMFSTSTPQEIMAQQVEDEFGKQIDAVEEGRKVRQMQNDLVSYMFGG